MPTSSKRVCRSTWTTIGSCPVRPDTERHRQHALRRLRAAAGDPARRLGDRADHPPEPLPRRSRSHPGARRRLDDDRSRRPSRSEGRSAAAAVLAGPVLERLYAHAAPLIQERQGRCARPLPGPRACRVGTVLRSSKTASAARASAAGRVAAGPGPAAAARVSRCPDAQERAIIYLANTFRHCQAIYAAILWRGRHN